MYTVHNKTVLANPALAQRVVERMPLGRWGGHLLPIDGGANNIIRLTP